MPTFTLRQIKRFLAHLGNCPLRETGGIRMLYVFQPRPTCTCGLDKLIAKQRKAEREQSPYR